MAMSRGKAWALSATSGMLAALGGCAAPTSGQSTPPAVPEYPPAPPVPVVSTAPKVEPKPAQKVARDADEGARRGSKDCCKGTNECKGKGMCKTDMNACKGRNACKGQGGCRSPDCKE